MDYMKDVYRTLLRCEAGGARIELSVFPDGSYAVRKSGRAHSVWEPAERDACIRTFGSLAGLDHDGPTARPTVVMMVRRGTLDAIPQAEHGLN